MEDATAHPGVLDLRPEVGEIRGVQRRLDLERTGPLLQFIVAML